jgi:hypothetical protein
MRVHAIAVHDDLIDRFATEMPLREQVAKALFNKRFNGRDPSGGAKTRRLMLPEEQNIGQSFLRLLQSIR